MATIDYREFNAFQTKFYTNIKEFNELSKFEIKRHGYTLLNNLAKGYPHLADLILNLKGFDWNGPESHQILIALQRNFINNFNTIRVPKFIYWKNLKNTVVKERVKKTKKGLEFGSEITKKIQSILLYDDKTFESFKYSEKVQNLGKQLLGEIEQTEKLKTKKTKK